MRRSKGISDLSANDQYGKPIVSFREASLLPDDDRDDFVVAIVTIAMPGAVPPRPVQELIFVEIFKV